MSCDICPLCKQLFLVALKTFNSRFCFIPAGRFPVSFLTSSSSVLESQSLNRPEVILDKYATEAFLCSLHIHLTGFVGRQSTDVVHFKNKIKSQLAAYFWILALRSL